MQDSIEPLSIPHREEAPAAAMPRPGSMTIASYDWSEIRRAVEASAAVRVALGSQPVRGPLPF